MNCQPKQLAWIKVPVAFQRFGVEQLSNRIVETQQLLPARKESTWAVEPPQAIMLTGGIVDGQGTRAAAGQVFEFTGIPDSWLVPLKGDGQPTKQGQLPVLEQTL